jgi:hypothetical protein
MFYNAAAKSGVEIHLNRPARAVDESSPAVLFEDGCVVQGDLVIDGDGPRHCNIYGLPRLTSLSGTRSKVRDAVFPDFSPQVRGRVCFADHSRQVVMERSAATEILYDNPSLQVWMGPGRTNVSSTTTKRQLYDVQITDHDYGFELNHRPEAWNERVYNMTWLHHRFSDFKQTVRAISLKRRATGSGDSRIYLSLLCLLGHARTGRLCLSAMLPMQWYSGLTGNRCSRTNARPGTL